MVVSLKHSSGITKCVKMGFSWTTFFFGAFVPLIRGDLKWAVILFFLGGAAGVFTLGIGAIVVALIFAFHYNRLYLKELLEKGYVAEYEVYTRDIQEYVNK